MESAAASGGLRPALNGLTAILEEAQRLGFLGPGPVDRHVAHALAMAACLPGDARRGLDLGSGGGVPGLVLAAACSGLEIVLLDAKERRCRFLRHAVTALDLVSRAEVVEARAEEAARRPDLRERMDVVVARSFSLPAVTAECATGFLRPGGHLIVSEPPEGAEAAGCRWPEDALDTLGFGPAALCGGGAGAFAVLEKRRSEERWPRRVGVPSKRPLWGG
jgi:16S rRNA (guanine527-N7)-methyltransferase